ncbi:MAG: tRNA 2-thiouridine(34) synthase MnmA [Bacilli bacterium]|nr:tRNA 2-thiouridine(34) synthase MnmA [Bacilli bacterium]MDD4076500.1 tRNA 2-thiouridine(34) synthase MnmA [Bacilli bacterium]MDD4387620.1 tRNA 2-thiouridine(34) synthase MnmA [Bacilli bacterium]
MKDKKKVILGLSGGVDSAVAAILLLQQGYDVEGVFMRNWDSSLNKDILGNPYIYDEVCPQERDYIDALKVADKLNIKMHRVDFVEEYWQKVFTYFIDEYRNNRTPNPDIICNTEIKFKSFLLAAEKMGADFIAMGHYVRIEHYPTVKLLRGIDLNKDQSYFLSQLSKNQLKKSLFPIGGLYKKEVRKIAAEYNLDVATKKDSTGVCFIGERKFRKFLQNYIPAQPGDIETLEGEKVGVHEGIMYYTIGQRHGLRLGGAGEPWYVLGKDAKRNILIVGRGGNHEYLYSNRALINKINWLGPEFSEIDCTVKFRYRSSDIKAIVRKIDHDRLEVSYPDKAKAVTPGQAAVFYLGNEILGGGTIDKVYMNDQMRCY